MMLPHKTHHYMIHLSHFTPYYLKHLILTVDFRVPPPPEIIQLVPLSLLEIQPGYS